jgi:hypothetical protein
MNIAQVPCRTNAALRSTYCSDHPLYSEALTQPNKIPRIAISPPTPAGNWSADRRDRGTRFIAALVVRSTLFRGFLEAFNDSARPSEQSPQPHTKRASAGSLVLFSKGPNFRSVNSVKPLAYF